MFFESFGTAITISISEIKAIYIKTARFWQILSIISATHPFFIK